MEFLLRKVLWKKGENVFSFEKNGIDYLKMGEDELDLFKDDWMMLNNLMKELNN